MRLLPGESPQEPFYPYHRIVLPPPSDTQLNDGRPDNPLIRLAQDNPDEYYEYSESSGSDIYPSKLSRITEVSEDEEDSRDWPPAPPTLPSQASRSVSAWSSEMDYGQVISRSISKSGYLSTLIHSNFRTPFSWSP